MKVLMLSDETKLNVCDLSQPTTIVNVFRSLELATSFQTDYLTEELLTGAKLDDDDVVPPMDNMSYTKDKNGNITAKYFAKADEPETENINE